MSDYRSFSTGNAFQARALQPVAGKTKLSKSIKAISMALVLAPLSSIGFAEEASSDESIETLTIKGNALYDVPSSEELTGYNVDAATVGTKTPASLKDIPQSITVLTNELIEDRGFVYLDDATKATPGLRTLTNDSGRSSIFSRGYEYDDLLIDGLPAPISSILGSLPSLSAIDRIEIMRGPSGLFSSTSELGGIMNLVRKRATEETQASVTAGYGSYGRYQAEADVSGALNNSGSVRGRVVASQVDNSSQTEGNDNINQSLYSTVEIDLTDRTELSVGLLYQTKDLTPNNGLPTYDDGSLIDVDTSTFIGADWNEFTSSSLDVFADLTHQFSNGGRGRVAARASSREADYEYAYSFDSADANGDFDSLRGAYAEAEQLALAIDASYSQPFEAFGHVSEFVVGIDHKQEDTDQTSAAAVVAGSFNVFDFDSSAISNSLFDFSNTSDSESTESEQAVYGKLTLRPVADLAVITGARMSRYEISTGTDEADGFAFTPYAGLVYDLTDSQALYASYSQVFNPQTEVDDNGDFIDPRVGQQYEAGIKGSYANGLLNSRLTVFQLTDKNRAYDEDDDDAYEASGELQVRGFEAEVSGQYGPLDILAGYTYMTTETISGSDNSRFTLMPEHSVNIWSKYNFTSENAVLRDASVGAGVTAVSEFSVYGTDITAPAYATVDASLSKSIGENLKMSFRVNNILDEKYYARVGSTLLFNFYGESRSYMANATYSF
ncbi:TonB-dependent siderophore receptor [Reinekea thalattae]|uniref:TonB-dependent siderophore receptor n=1 Tax=Reinekea thalattae TaxID=2593301 RepID=A0A5C8Z9H7_9GAMM|nr:TonB-dependent siderophore receptor [Reinekea thalattae]TXR53903.1 TonB-dependent siderophore receptor [Reinekea thalattae]